MRFPLFSSNVQYFEEAEKGPERSRAGVARIPLGRTLDRSGAAASVAVPGVSAAGPPAIYQVPFLLHLCKLRIAAGDNGGYNEFEEDGMDASNLFADLRVIEQLHQELDEERRTCKEAVSKVAELEQSREEAVSLAGQRLRDTARNILRLAACCTCGFFAYPCKKSRLMGMLSEFTWYIFAINCKNIHKMREAQQTLGLSVEQVAQATGLPPETVRTLASRP
jgi:hypothetical protein